MVERLSDDMHRIAMMPHGTSSLAMPWHTTCVESTQFGVLHERNAEPTEE
jgi:hypothetical protein